MMCGNFKTLPLLMSLGGLLLPSVRAVAEGIKREGIKRKVPSDFLVQGLEDIEPAFGLFQGDMFAGRIPISQTDEDRGMIMFWLFAPYEPSVKDSMVIWLNGGPGCSSFNAGLMLENSPVTVQPRRAGFCCTGEDEPLVFNEHAWTKATYMMYVEQPAGTGFSTGIMPKDEDDVTRDFVDWLSNFYLIFSHLDRYDLFFFGESYAGMYVPSIARGIYLENEKRRKQRVGKAKDSRKLIPLKGIGIGNGWLDVQTQGPAVIDFAYWHGMIDVATREYYHTIWEQCFASGLADDGADLGEPFHPFTTGDECGIQTAVLESAGEGLLDDMNMSPNTFDVTTWDTYPAFGTTIHSFYNNPKVQKCLNAPIGEWSGCQRHQTDEGTRRLKMLDHDRPLSMLPYIAELLDDAKIRVLVYNAAEDLSVSAPASEQALNRMEWSHGGDEWLYANRTLWLVEKDDEDDDPLSPVVAGYAKQLDRLSFLVVRNSGHLVPYNVPKNSLNLLSRFLEGKPPGDLTLPNYAMQSKIPDTKRSQEHTHFAVSNQKADCSLKGLLLSNTATAIVAFLAGMGAVSLKRKSGYTSLPSH